MLISYWVSGIIADAQGTAVNKTDQTLHLQGVIFRLVDKLICRKKCSVGGINLLGPGKELDKEL